jgi:hypothetical protein
MFEYILIGLYDANAKSFGSVTFFDVLTAPPRLAYDRRNKTTFKWAEGQSEVMQNPQSEDDEDEDE